MIRCGPLDLIDVEDVELERRTRPHLLHGLGRTRGVAVGNDDVGAVIGQAAGDLATDARAAADDHRRLAREVE